MPTKSPPMMKIFNIRFNEYSVRPVHIEVAATTDWTKSGIKNIMINRHLETLTDYYSAMFSGKARMPSDYFLKNGMVGDLTKYQRARQEQGLRIIKHFKEALPPVGFKKFQQVRVDDHGVHEAPVEWAFNNKEPSWAHDDWK